MGRASLATFPSDRCLECATRAGRHRHPDAYATGGTLGFGLHQPLVTRLLQVLQLRRGQLQRPGHRSGCCGLAMGHLFPHHVATGNQFLHFPVDELHDRRLPGPGGVHPQPDRFCLLCLDVSPVGRWTDHSLSRGGPATRTANPHAREVRSWNGAVQPRPGQEGPAGQLVRPAGRPGGRAGRRRLIDHHLPVVPDLAGRRGQTDLQGAHRGRLPVRA